MVMGNDPNTVTKLRESSLVCGRKTVRRRAQTQRQPSIPATS